MTNLKTLLIGASAAAIITACSGENAHTKTANVDTEPETYASETDAITTPDAQTDETIEMVQSDQVLENSEVFLDADADANLDSPATIVEIASGSEDFDTLTRLVAAADLTETLDAEGPFTVFAPNDDAFDAVDPAILAALEEEENLIELKGTLTYHVVPGKIQAADLVNAIDENDGRYEIETVNGAVLYATKEEGRVYLTDETDARMEIILTDLQAENGVIHVINGVALTS